MTSFSFFNLLRGRGNEEEKRLQRNYSNTVLSIGGIRYVSLANKKIIIMFTTSETKILGIIMYKHLLQERVRLL